MSVAQRSEARIVRRESPAVKTGRDAWALVKNDTDIDEAADDQQDDGDEPQPKGCSDSTRHPIQSVKRAFALLQQLNVNNGASVHHLASAVNLPRGTVHRILETMRILGYVRKDPHTRGYWVDEHAQRLSSGYSDQSWILDVGDRVVNRIHAETKFSSVLTTPDNANGEMIVRVATILRNPAGGHRTTAGTHVPMGNSSSGHSYLAHCEPELRAELLDTMFREEKTGSKSAPFVHNFVALERPLAERMLGVIRRQGYALGHSSHDASAKMGVLAVPIKRNDDVIGCLSLNFYYSSLKAVPLSSHITRLTTAAAEIGAAASSRKPG